VKPGAYQCYARLTDVRTGERLPTFSVQLEPPPESDDQSAVVKDMLISVVALGTILA